MLSLPKHWKPVSLKEVVSYRKGKKPKNLSNIKKAETVPYIDIKAFSTGEIRQYADLKSSNLAFKEDVLIVWDGARCGLAGIGQEGAIGSTIMSLHPIEINSLYLFRFFQTQYEVINSNPRGTGIPHVDPELFWNIQLPIAPFNEQYRIVVKLEKLLAKIDACKERLDKIPVILKRFRQSVLAAACSGRLTTDYRKKIGEDLNDWEVVLLKDVAKLRLGKMLDRAKNVGKLERYLKNLNVRWFSFDFMNLAFIKVTSKEKEELSIHDGDLLVCEGGEPGRCAVWDNGKTDIVFQKAIHRVRTNENILPTWLAFNLKNDSNSGALENYFTGTTIKHLTGKSLAQYQFRLPPLSEQQEIVRRVEDLFRIANRIEDRYNKAKAHVDKLTQSILANAFRGELVPRDPNDEPASKLLERIKVEKEKVKDKKVKSRRKN
jgi:type I restriction enzyme, S subunit